MKKWIVALLVVLAVLVLVSPGIVGLIAEKGLQEVVDETGGSADIAVTTERFDREWFSSAGRHRVELRRGDLYRTARELALEAGEEQVPALIIDTELQHGIRPIGGGPGNLMPVLARSESTLQLEATDGELINIPGKLYSEVGLTGTTRSRYLLEAGSHDADRARIQWGGADLEFSITPSGSWASLAGTVEPWSIDSEVSGMRSGPMTVDAEAVDTEFGFRTGSIDLDIAELSINDANEPLAMKKLSLRGESEISRKRLNGDAEISVESLYVPMLGEASADLSLRARDLDAQTLRRIYIALQRANRSGSADMAATAIDDVTRDDLLLLLSKGFELGIERLKITLPQGDVNGSLSLELPSDNVDKAKPWSSLALQANAAINLEIDEALMDMAQAAEPNIGSLVALGYLRREGDRYQLVAEVKNGQFVINGAPMSLPMMFD